MANASNDDWNESYPADAEYVGAGNEEIMFLRGALRTRLLKEHVAPAAAGVGGEHLAGSAMVFIDDYTAALPTLRPDGITAFTADDLGRVAYDTVSGKFYVLTADTPTWTQIGKAGGQIAQVEGITDITNTSADWADMTDMTQTITTTGGDIVLTFTGTIRVVGALGIRFTSKIGLADALPYCTQVRKSDQTEPGDTLSMSYLITGLVAGEYTFKVQWKDTSGTVYQYGTQCPRVFIVEEKPV